MLIPVAGKPLLQRVVDQVSRAKNVSKIVVATSNHVSDDQIASYCNMQNIDYYRGPLENVARRFVKILHRENAESFVRVCGDSPLIDPKIIDKAISYYREGKIDLVTNIATRTYPKGQSVEVINSKTFINAYDSFNCPKHFEHVTGFFYENLVSYVVVNFSNKKNYSQKSLCVDTQDDLRRIERIIYECGEELENWEKTVSR